VLSIEISSLCSSAGPESKSTAIAGKTLMIWSVLIAPLQQSDSTSNVSAVVRDCQQHLREISLFDWVRAVPSPSMLDGWWLQGHVEGVTGWAIGTDQQDRHDEAEETSVHAAALHAVLEHSVVPLFYERRHAFIDVMRGALALNGSFFTAQRMLLEYVIKA
jgi:hypothetical protein